MELYINGIGAISPQKTFDNSVFLEEVLSYSTNKMMCVDPDYSLFFDGRAIRRMSRILKFGIAAAMIAIDDAGKPELDAISTGTGFGCLEDSEIFLRNIVAENEGVVSPTPFIQSTHNTVSGQIALLLKCQKANNTFSHKGFSFESALLDARLNALDYPTQQNFLVGSSDEVSTASYAIMSRMNIFRKEPCDNLSQLASLGKGVIAGEGAAYVVLGKSATENSYGRFVDVKMISNPKNEAAIEKAIHTFLAQHQLSVSDVDIVISGLCGDESRDALLKYCNENVYTEQSIVGFKHLCGEYMTASSFAVWLGAKMLKTQQVPELVVLRNTARTPKTILIHNAYKTNHSLILLKQ